MRFNTEDDDCQPVPGEEVGFPKLAFPAWTKIIITPTAAESPSHLYLLLLLLLPVTSVALAAVHCVLRRRAEMRRENDIEESEASLLPHGTQGSCAAGNSDFDLDGVSLRAASPNREA